MVENILQRPLSVDTKTDTWSGCRVCDCERNMKFGVLIELVHHMVEFSCQPGSLNEIRIWILIFGVLKREETETLRQWTFLRKRIEFCIFNKRVGWGCFRSFPPFIKRLWRTGETHINTCPQLLQIKHTVFYLFTREACQKGQLCWLSQKSTLKTKNVFLELLNSTPRIPHVQTLLLQECIVVPKNSKDVVYEEKERWNQAVWKWEFAFNDGTELVFLGLQRVTKNSEAFLAIDKLFNAFSLRQNRGNNVSIKQPSSVRRLRDLFELFIWCFSRQKSFVQHLSSLVRKPIGKCFDKIHPFHFQKVLCCEIQTVGETPYWMEFVELICCVAQCCRIRRFKQVVIPIFPPIIFVAPSVHTETSFSNGDRRSTNLLKMKCATPLPVEWGQIAKNKGSCKVLSRKENLTKQESRCSFFTKEESTAMEKNEHSFMFCSMTSFFFCCSFI